MEKSYYLKCYRCGKSHVETESVTSCTKCHGPLETYYYYEVLHKKLNIFSLKTAALSALKYVAFYPIDNFQNIISLDEGGTPLVHAKTLGEKLGIKNLFIKNEGINPTGCFKDRGTLVEVTKAIEMGAKAICLASTGNMAASVAAYSSAAKIPCYILVPEGTTVGKLSQTLTFGARVIQVRGSYSECAELAEQISKKFGYYLAGDYTFRTEGQKSQGYEIIEQLYWNSPDYIVCPIGCGTNFHAIYKGLKEFYDLELIHKMPKLIGVQTPGCNPIVQAYQKKQKTYEVVKHPNTVASAIAAGDPLDGEKILYDIYESKGCVIEVTDDYLLEAQQEQARLAGVFAEPSGVLAYAGAKKLAAENYFQKKDVVVCIATGNGLKDPKSPLTILPEPASVDPDFDQIAHFITHKLYAIKESGQTERTKLLFSHPPEKTEIKKTLKKEFDIDAGKEITNGVTKIIGNFLEKGKEIKKSDLQYILEEVLDEISLKESVLEIRDFRITTSMHLQAEAHIEVTAFKQDLTFSSTGSGSVDAIISALYKGLKEHDTQEVRLKDYEVAIDSKSVDSSVEVKMTLFDKQGNKVVSRATSPDVIVASVKAYEKGFNLLYASP